MQLVAQGVHGLPEAVVAIGGELAFMGQALHGFTLPDGGVAVDVVDDLGGEDEEAAVDPGAVPVGLFLEAGDLGFREIECAKATGWLGGGQGGQFALFPVEGDQGADVDVADAVTVGEAEIVAVEVGANALEAPPGHGLFPGIDQGDAPGLRMLFVDLHAVGAQVEGHVGHVQVVVGEVFLDDVALVATADDEVLDAMGGVELHDVPEDRLAADLDHGLGLEVGFLGKSGAETAGEDDGFHGCNSSKLRRSVLGRSFQLVAHSARSYKRWSSMNHTGVIGRSGRGCVSEHHAVFNTKGHGGHQHVLARVKCCIISP